MVTEGPRRPNISQTGPEPLEKENIEAISYRLKEGRIGIWRRARLTEQSTENISAEGAFIVTHHSPFHSFMYDQDIFWSKHLLEIDPTKNTLQIGREYGSLRVCDPTTRKVKAIIPASELRKVDKNFYFKGVVTKSGFVFPTDFPRYTLGQKLTPEQLEELLLKAEEGTPPQPYYRLMKGFAKVDPILHDTEVLVLPFEFSLSPGVENVMKRDAVVIDTAKRKLIPRVFINLPEQTK